MSKFFKPGLKAELLYHPDQLLHENFLDMGNARIGLSIPIKSKFAIKADLSKFKWTDLKDLGNWKKLGSNLQKYLTPKMHQIIWNVNVNYYRLQMRDVFDNQPDFNAELNLVGLNTGVTGFHYLKKARVLFYSGNVGLVENISEIKGTRPHGAILGGVAQMTGINSVMYFGAYLGAGNGTVLPAPIFGFDTKIAKKLRLNVTLPVQVKLTYKQKKNKLSAYVALSGFLSGFENSSNQYVTGALTASFFKTGLNYNLKVGKRMRFYIDAGWADWRRFNFGVTTTEATKARLQGTPYIGFGIDKKLGKSLFDSSIGNMLN